MSTESTTPYLEPVTNPKGLMLKLGYRYSRKEFGKVFSPLSVFNARMPGAFARFYMRVGKLDKQLAIPAGLRALLREQVATINGCAFCMDATRFAALRESAANEARLDALGEYSDSPHFSPAEVAALDYVSELTRERAVEPETFAALARHYSEREICDIVYLVATEHLYNLTNVGLGIGSDGLCEVAAGAGAA